MALDFFPLDHVLSKQGKSATPSLSFARSLGAGLHTGLGDPVQYDVT